MRIMAIDYGDARIGLAVSDPTGLICGEAWTMEEWNMERAARRICEEAEKSRDFKSMLEAGGSIPVTLWDERRSSIEAHAILHAAGKRERAHRRTVDAVAASLILEGYLDSIR